MRTRGARGDGLQSKLRMLPLPVDDPARRRPDITRARTVLGWEPKVQLREGLNLCIPYFTHAVEESARSRPQPADWVFAIQPVRKPALSTLLAAAAVLSFLTTPLAHGAAGERRRLLRLHEGWWLASGCKVAANGRAIVDCFLPAAGADAWTATAVPSTVLAAQVSAGEFTDPYFDRNLRDDPQGRIIPSAKSSRGCRCRRTAPTRAPGGIARASPCRDGAREDAVAAIRRDQLSGEHLGEWPATGGIDRGCGRVSHV